MQFTFHNPTRIHFGAGQIARIAEEIPANARILLTFGGGSIHRNGVHAQVLAALAGRTVLEFGGIEPNPSYETLIKAVELARAERIDYLLAVGGGSVLDGTKWIAAAVPFVGDPWEIISRQAPVTAAIPLGAVLTLPATGSEANGNAVISRHSTGEKLYFGSPLVFPKFAILDPETTRSLVPRQVGNGIVDAFVHVCEQYLVSRPGTVVQDRQAEAILLALRELGPAAAAGRSDPAVLAGVMWAATNALNTLIGCGVAQDWATHAIGHEITALAGLDHAQTLAVVLPALLRHQKGLKHAKLLQYAERVWDLRDGTPEARIEAAIARTEAFFREVGVPTRLADYHVDAGIASQVAERLRRRGDLLGEARDLTPERVEALLRSAA